MESTNCYKILLEFSENIEKIKQKYMYSFSDHESLADITKIDTKIKEMGKAYSITVAEYIKKINTQLESSTTIEFVYYRSLIYNILKGNITILMSNILIDTNLVIRIDVDRYCDDIVYNNKELVGI